MIREDYTIIAGHGRLLAAKKLNLKQVPTIDCSDLTEAQKKAYIIADNKLALNAGWDSVMLTAELQELEELGFDLDLLGFDDKEINKLLAPEVTEGLLQGALKYLGSNKLDASVFDYIEI